MSKGIVSQLPSSHLSIHRVPAKLLDGVVPHGKNRCRLQLLFFCLIVTDLPSTVMVLIYSVDATPLQPSVRLCADVVHFTLHLIYGFLFQNPAQSPIPFYQPLSRVLDYVAYVFCLSCFNIHFEYLLCF